MDRFKTFFRSFISDKKLCLCMKHPLLNFCWSTAISSVNATILKQINFLTNVILLLKIANFIVELYVLKGAEPNKKSLSTQKDYVLLDFTKNWYCVLFENFAKNHGIFEDSRNTSTMLTSICYSNIQLWIHVFQQ